MQVARTLVAFLCLTVSLGAVAQGTASDSQEVKGEVAKKLNNAIADLTSVPFQNNWDYGIGPANAQHYQLNFQPVIPFHLSEDWNLISRTIVPIHSLQSPIPGGSTTSGLGDITQSLFLVPRSKTAHGWMWGVGPVLLYPTASHDELGTGKWAAGPTFIVIKQDAHGFTYGMLVNQLWSFAGWGTSAVNMLFLQPGFGYTVKKTYTTLAADTETSYDWKKEQWTVPINVYLTQVLKVKSQIFSVQFGYRYYAHKPEGGPNHGLRATLTLVFL